MSFVHELNVWFGLMALLEQMWPASELFCRFMEAEHSRLVSSPSSTRVIELGNCFIVLVVIYSAFFMNYEPSTLFMFVIFVSKFVTIIILFHIRN